MGSSTKLAENVSNARVVSRRRALVVAVSLVVAIAGVGCSSTQPAPAPPTTAPVTAARGSSFVEGLARAKKDATVSDAQVSALDKAVKSGEMSFEEISALLEDTFACFESAKIAYRRTDDREPAPGFKVPTYSFSEPVAVADSCQTRFSEYAYKAYQGQPKVAELKDAALKAEIPQVLACLRRNGVAIDDNATLDEIRTAAFDLYKATFSNTEPVVCTAYL